MFLFQRIIFSTVFFFHSLTIASQGQVIKLVDSVSYLKLATVKKKDVNVHFFHKADEVDYVSESSCLLKRLLMQRNVIQISSFFNNQDVLINPWWNGYSIVSKGGDRLTVIDVACNISNIAIIEKILQRSHKDCFIDIVESLAQQNSGNVLALFLTNHKERAYAEKFSIWRVAVQRESLWEKNLKPVSDTKGPLFDNLLKLLFDNNINAIDENGNTLLHIAVYEHNTEAMQYLLRNKANAELLNKKGYAPIHYAFTDVKMVSCLYAHWANLNLQSRNGETCLNSADEVFFSPNITEKEAEEIEKSISFLVEKGAKR